VEATARAIAAGDLSRRVPDHPRRTEIGQVSAAVNVMLSQIETSVREREGSAAAARTSEERMRRFVTDASHELRTPLTSIRGFAELYRQGAAAPENVPSLIRRIEDEATRMGLLVEDLLLLARLDQQRPLERVPVDLVTVATDAVHAARAADPERLIEVGVLGDDDPPGVIGDEGRLRQIADNLVGNACTHTPPGTPVRVGVGAETSNGRSWAVLEVADSGPGLSAEESARVFERFYRTDTSRARRTGGTGLGLSIVAALVAAHGGDVSVRSSPGQGATFRVRLPALN
jgi:two-component system OmpR family sensor kinase